MSQPAAKIATAPIQLELPATCLSDFEMDFNTFVLESYEVYAEGSGPEGWAKRRLNVDARWQAMGVGPEAVTPKDAAESSAFKGDYQALVKVVSAYELYASQTFVALERMQDDDLVDKGKQLDLSLQSSLREQQETTWG